MLPDPWLLALLCLAAAFAGCVDAVVGGGGLIQIPALFSAFPNTAPATLFGTNKCVGVIGTASAGVRYVRRVRLPWRTVIPATLMAFLFSYAGAAAVAWIPKGVMRPLMLFLLIAVTAYTIYNKKMGQSHNPTHSGAGQLFWASLLGGGIGFYDGFFGPGTGSFLLFLFVRFFGFDFLHASAASKVVNVATNLAAMAYFLPHGHWFPWLALWMALANITGAFVGTKLALQHGSVFVRKAFIVVASVLIVRFAWDL